MQPWGSLTEPTEWCSSIVQVQICVDLKKLNEAVRRERYILLNLKDIPPSLEESKVCSKLDMPQADF